MDRKTAARRAAVLLEQIAAIDARLPSQQHDVDRAKPGSAFHEQSVRKLAKTQANRARLLLELAQVRAATDDVALAAATAGRATKRQARAGGKKAAAPVPAKRAKGLAQAKRPPGSKVSVRRISPVAPNGAPTCRQCGTWAPLHTREGWCGACLRAHGQEPCGRCGAWLDARDLKRHRCGPDRSNSVNALQGGAPGLGRRH